MVDKMVKTFVAISQCTSYQHEEVQKALDKCMNSIGGISSYVKPGNKVPIKPNMLQGKSPEEATLLYGNMSRKSSLRRKKSIVPFNFIIFQK